MPVVHLGLKKKLACNSSLERFGLSIGSDGKISASDVEVVISKLEEALQEQRAQLEEIVEIRDHRAVCELEFAKRCGNIEFILEEFSLDALFNDKDNSSKSNNVVNINILSR